MFNRIPVALFVVILAATSAAAKDPLSSEYLIAQAKLAAPPNKTSTGKGRATVYLPYNAEANAMVVVNLTGSLDQITMAHIHVLKPPSGNAILVDLLPRLSNPIPARLDPPVSYKGSFSFVSYFNTTKLASWSPGATYQQFFSWLNSSMLYVNVHTVAAPGGAVQGYLSCKHRGCTYP